MATMTLMEIRQYESEIKDTNQLIAELNAYLSLSEKFDTTERYQQFISDKASLIGAKLTQVWQRRPDEAVVAALFLGACWVVAAGYDGVRNAMLAISKEEARKKLVPLYSELAIQKSLLEKKLREYTRTLQGRYNDTEEKLDEAETRKKQCEEFLRRIQACQNSINQF